MKNNVEKKSQRMLVYTRTHLKAYVRAIGKFLFLTFHFITTPPNHTQHDITIHDNNNIYSTHCTT